MDLTGRQRAYETPPDEELDRTGEYDEYVLGDDDPLGYEEWLEQEAEDAADEAADRRFRERREMECDYDQ